VIATAVDHAALENRPVETRSADDLLGRPLRFVISGAAVRPGAKEAEKDQLRDASFSGRLNDGEGSSDVNPLLGLAG